MDATRVAPPPSPWRDEVAFLRRVLIVAAVVALALLLWRTRNALLLVFGGVVVAVLLLAAARPIERRFGLSHTWALTVAGGGISLAILLIGLLIGGQVQSQVAQLGRQLPEAVQSFERRFGVEVPGFADAGARQGQGSAGGQTAGGDGAPSGSAAPQGGAGQGGAGQGGGGGGLDASAVGGVLRRIAGFGVVVVDALSAFVLAVIGGAFLAADPRLYRRGLVKLLPESQHARVEDALETSGRALRQWLLAQLIAMAMVGVLVGLGTWLIGLPSPLALALFAALVEFVPVIGPIVGAVPALLLALTQGGGAFLWTLLLFVAIQQVESNLIMPLVEKRMVQMPPALLLFSVVAVGAVFGLPGVILAAPLTVLAYVLVKKLYVRQTLGEETDVPGER